MTKTTRAVAAALFCSLPMLLAAQADTKSPTAGYSGNWFLDLQDKSPRARVYAGNRLLIEDAGTTWSLKSWRIVRGNEERAWEIAGSLDGKSCRVEFDVQAGNTRIGPLTCKLHREGDKIVMELIREVDRTTQRFTHELAPDGQSMNVAYQIHEHHRDQPTPPTVEVFKKN